MRYPQTCTLSLLLGTLTLPVACLRDSITSPRGAASPPGRVSVADNAFTPSVLSVPVGQTVTWEWHGSGLHDVTFDDPNIGSAEARRGGSFQWTFQTAGEFTYYCTIHGRSIMLGRVRVTVE